MLVLMIIAGVSLFYSGVFAQRSIGDPLDGVNMPLAALLAVVGGISMGLLVSG